jgi:hypothetical protein
MVQIGAALPIAGRDISAEAVATVAETAERMGLGSVWTFERLLRPTEPSMPRTDSAEAILTDLAAYLATIGENLFSVLLVIIPLIYLTEILPISINGLGVRESAFGFFFVLIGHTVEEGLAVSLLVIGMRYLLGLLGGTLLLLTLVTSRASGTSVAAVPDAGAEEHQLAPPLRAARQG